MVTHNESLAMNCDRILHIEDGRLVRDRNLDKGGALL